MGVLRTVERSGLRKGMAGSKPWFYVGTGLWTLRTVRRLAERKDEVLLSEVLKPGQRIVIANGRATIDDGPAPAAATKVKGRKGRKGRKATKAQQKADAKAAKRARRSKTPAAS